jgi:hypothetical protein
MESNKYRCWFFLFWSIYTSINCFGHTVWIKEYIWNNNMIKYKNSKTFEDINNNIEQLIDVLNHRVTSLESDVCWLKKIGYYMAALLTTITVKLLFLGG